MRAKKNSAVITVEMFTDDRSTTYTLFINGTRVVTGYHYGINEDAYDYENLAALSGSEVYYMNAIASQEDIDSLPEPTALALLALGVAGVALQRKAA